MVLIKICGLTNLEDCLNAIEAGADYLGFNFYPKSPRYLNPEMAAAIFQGLPGGIPKVGVFVNEPLHKVVDLAIQLELDYLQFHGDETAEELNELGRPWYKAFRLHHEADLEKIANYNCEWIMLDAYSANHYGGTGQVCDWNLVDQAKKFGKPIILAGGLTPDNVESAIQQTHPMMVDVASGVEVSPGVKLKIRMLDFVNHVKGTGLRVIK